MSKKPAKRPRIPCEENGYEHDTKKRVLQKCRRAVCFSRPNELQKTREQLPVFMHEQEIIDVLRQHDVVVVSGETGSGKTTQVPQFLLEEFMGAETEWCGTIVVTQPRRVAAIACAKRVAAELGEKRLGQLVGYHVRHQPVIGPKTRLKFVTDGVLLREIEQDLLMTKYDAVVIDEAHERSLNTDYLLALLSRSLTMRRTLKKPLKLVVMSATLDIEGIFAGEQALFPKTRTVSVAARQHPVTVHFARVTHENYIEQAFKKVCKIHTRLPPGGILVFVSGRQEVIQLCQMIEEKFEGAEVCPEGASMNLKVQVLPFYALLPDNQQHSVFNDLGPSVRKVVVATNVAETSVTIPGITYVVDTGKVKEQVYGGTGCGLLSSFVVRWVSKASAEQRKGRAGRTGPGHTYRLYSSAVFDQQFRDFRVPEVLRVPADSIVLRLRSLGILHVNKFPFPTKPDPGALSAAQTVLERIGALRGDNGVVSNLADITGRKTLVSDSDVLLGVTTVGRELAKLPLPPRFARLLLAAKSSSQDIVLLSCRVAAMLSVGSVFDRCSDVGLQRHSLYAHASSDVLTQLNAICAAERNIGDMREYCLTHSLHFKTLSEILATARQLEKTLFRKDDTSRTEDVTHLETSSSVPKRVTVPMEKMIIRAMLCGFPDKIARRLSRDEAAAYGVPSRWVGSAFAVCGYRDVVYLPSRSPVRLNNDVRFVVFSGLVSVGGGNRKQLKTAVSDDESDIDSNSDFNRAESKNGEGTDQRDSNLQKTERLARTIMENVSVVNASWIAQNATSMCRFEVNKAGRATNINPVHAVYDVSCDSVLISMLAKYGSSGWHLGTVMVPFRASIAFLKTNCPDNEKDLRRVRESASSAFGTAIHRREIVLPGWNGLVDGRKGSLSTLRAELMRNDIYSKREWKRNMSR